MKHLKTLILFLTVFSAVKLSAQINDLNAYRFAEIDPPTKGTTQNNITKEDLRITNLIEGLLSEKGFLLVPRDDSGRTPTYGGKSEMPIEVQKNKCLNLIWFWGFSPADPSNQTLKIMAVNCRDEIVFQNSFRLPPGATVDNGIRTLLHPVLLSNYQFNESLNLKKFIPRVDVTNESEETLRRYFSSQQTHPLEGLYKSIDTNLKEDPSYYKIGVKLVDGRYQMIVVETDNEIWRSGEVKGYIEKEDNTNL
ncbi:MAG TPA: hypothetical protein VIM65_17450, partial [Cyclobacteriaceae bacterium]